MSWRESIVRVLGGVTRGDVAARVQEAIAALPASRGLDPDEWKFRRLTASTPTRELTPLEQDRMIETAVYLYVMNPLAGSLLDIQRDFIVGKGFSAQSQDPDVDRVLQRFWGDGCNRMDLKLPEKVLQLSLFGEQCWPAFTSDNYGLVRLGYVDPVQIEAVLPDPDNVEQLVAVITRDAMGRKGKRYRIILNEDEAQIVSPAAIRIREACTDGDAFYFSVNRLSNMTRGISDLMRLLDWCDAYEEFLFENLERMAKHLMTFIWDVTYEGATEEQIEEKLRKMRPPRRGSVRAHNERVKWDAVAPDLKSYETGEAMQNFKRHIIGTGARLPLTWFGDPEDSNRASAGEMNDPPIVKLSARQLYVKYAVTEVLRYQLAQARARGTLTRDEVQLLDADGKALGKPVALKDAFSVTAPEISTKDTAKIATALVSLTTSLTMAEQQGWISKSKAAELFAAVAKQLGPEIDVAREVQDERVTADYADGHDSKIRRLRDVARMRNAE